MKIIAVLDVPEGDFCWKEYEFPLCNQMDTIYSKCRLFPDAERKELKGGQGAINGEFKCQQCLDAEIKE